MANIKQQIKRAKTDEKKRLQNRVFKSQMRTAVKKVLNSTSKDDIQEVKAFFNLANKSLDKLVSQKIKKHNFVNRKKSQISKHINKITEDSKE